MAPAASPPQNHYMIFRHEKVGFTDVLRLLFTRRGLTEYDFVECSSHTADELKHVHADWSIALLAVVERILFAIGTPLKWVGMIVEFFLNLWCLNGGLLGLLRRTLTAGSRIKIPVPDTASYKSIIGHIDERFDLYKDATPLSSLPFMGDLGDINPLDLTVMASKMAYENEAYIKDVVNNHWKMHFVEYFNCWNKFLGEKTTQAFVLCDRREDARVICVAFRGTETFNARDWLTDVDISYISMGAGMGRVHMGFMKALGMLDETDFSKGFPRQLPDNNNNSTSKPLAYYAIRESLRSLLGQHPKARILVTGHSLGAALASLFPALLVYHREEEILDRMMGVITHAQPRVGDEAFKLHMESAAADRVRLYRTVYRHDVVPRVPFDSPPLGLFKHFGTCIYFHSWYKAQVVGEVPNPNYFLDPKFLIPMHLNACGDLVRGFFLGRLQGKDYEEGWMSILYRLSGLLIPGVASHSPRDYVNGARLATIHGLTS